MSVETSVNAEVNRATSAACALRLGISDSRPDCSTFNVWLILVDKENVGLKTIPSIWLIVGIVDMEAASAAKNADAADNEETMLMVADSNMVMA